MKAFQRSEQKRQREAELARLENYLRAHLHPVEPRPAFVSGLRARLAKESAGSMPAPMLFQYVLLSLAGIASGVLLLLASVRATMAVLGRLGVLQPARSPVETKRSTLL